MNAMPPLSPAALTALVLATYLLGINAVTWALFWLDKRRSAARKSRISEYNLLFLCAVGGTLGALAARRRFRHKTRKRSFTRKLNAIVVMQVLVLGFAVFTFGRAYLI